MQLQLRQGWWECSLQIDDASIHMMYGIDWIAVIAMKILLL